ncbi:MAG: hypothetical protein AAF791_15585 [Bacteroidota bacterium]
MVQVLQEQRRQAVLDAAAASVPPPVVRGLHVYPQTDPLLLAFDARDARRAFVADSTARAVADRLARLGAEADTLVAWHKVRPEAQGGFLASYRETLWQALSSVAPTRMDTMRTLELRSRLTQRFGTPTRNAAAARQERYAGAETVQFEYWFVANDSIPVLVLDTHGPFGRGLLIASDEQYRADFPRLKADFARRVLSAPPTVEFLDYYRHPETEQWYKTGFDGTVFFTEAVRRPRWARNFGGDKWKIHR